MTMYLKQDSDHIKSNLHHRLTNQKGGAGWRPLRLGEAVPPTSRTLKFITKEEAERKKRKPASNGVAREADPLLFGRDQP